MPNAWGQVVEQPVGDNGQSRVQIGATRKVVGNVFSFTLSNGYFTQGLSTAFLGIFNLLNAQLPAVSTAPTKTATRSFLYLFSYSRSAS